MNKKEIKKDFRTFISSGKTDTFERYGMDVVMGKREGCYFWDIDRKHKWINCHSNGGVFNLGHHNPIIREALVKGSETYDIGNHHFISERRAALGKKIAELMPEDLDCTVFGVSGGEATDLAIKLARGYTKRNNIISAIGGYHGHTGFSLAAGDLQYREPFGEMAPGFKQIPFNDIAAMESAINKDTAAVILETIPATLGIYIPDKDYLKNVKELCKKNGALLILDEVQTGLGRTGKLWGFQNFNVVPDIVVLGKGLSGGMYPMSATVFRKPLETFFNKNPFIHVSTFGGSELGAEVTLKVLEISSEPKFLKNVNQMAEYLSKGYKVLAGKYHDHIVGFRQLGLMTGIEFRTENYGLLFTKAAYQSGLFTLYSNNDKRVCQLLPPLIIGKEQVDEIIHKIDIAIPKLKLYNIAFSIKEFIDNLKVF